MNISDYAKMILVNKPVIVPKSKALESRILQISESMFNNEKQRNNRTLEQIIKANKNSTIEMALQKQCPNLIMNPKKWSSFDPDSFAYDNIDVETGSTFEGKRWSHDTPTGEIAKWWSYPADSLDTLRKYISLVSFVYGAKLIEHPDSFEVHFLMLAEGKSFFKYIRKSMYKKDEVYYNHYNAMRDGECIRNTNIKFGD